MTRRRPSLLPRAARLAASLALLLGPLAACVGCTSTEGQCETVCDWQQRCVQGSVSIQDCSQQCVVDAEKRSSECDDAFDEFATCAADNQSCPGVDKQCGAEADRLIRKCDCKNPRPGSPLAELCAK